MLFAVSAGGYLIALNTAGELQTVFDSNGDGVADATSAQIMASGGFSGLTGLTGLAFTPLDFNLWHPTSRRGDPDTIANIGAGATVADIQGHGINRPFDNTRAAVDREPSDQGGTGGDRVPRRMPSANRRAKAG